jgi:hypothetical protein
MKSVTNKETLDDDDGFILNIDVDPFDCVRNEKGVSKQTDRDWRAITFVYDSPQLLTDSNYFVKAKQRRRART